MKKWFNNLPIRNKLLGIMLVGLSVLVVMFFVIMQILSSEYNEMLYQSTSETLEFSEKGITAYIKKMEDLTGFFLSDAAVQRNLMYLKETNTGDNFSRTSLRNLGILLGDYYYNYADGILKYMSLYNSAKTLNTNLIAADKVPEKIRTMVLEHSDEKNGAFCLVSEYMGEYGLFLARNIRQIEGLTLEKLGTLVLNLDMDKLVAECANFDQKYGKSGYMIMADGKMLYHTENLEFKDSEISDFGKIEKYKIQKIGNIRYFISHGRIPEYGWDYYCLVSYENIAKRISEIRNVCGWIILLDVLLIVCLTFSFVDRLVVHISGLKDRMQRFAIDNSRIPETEYDYSGRNDELGTLNRQFNEMSRKIIELIQENYVNELLKKEAQIKALENQINPHFLYNTLDSIKWRAMAVGDRDISDMVESLGILLRTSLRSGNEINYNIGKEMEVVNSYITIQKFRYEERLIFEDTISLEWYSYDIPKMVLQPLIENAIFYGLEQNVDNCIILLTGEQKDDKLHFYIKNSGSEFEEELLEKLEKLEVLPHGNGVGLLNINKRVQIQYGKEYGLKLYNDDDYAVAELVIPIFCEERKYGDNV